MFYKKLSKLLTMLLIANLLIISSISSVSASSSKKENEIVYKPIDDITYIDPNGDIQPSAGGAILVFVGGILAGYIVDGILIETTGSSGGEWVAKAIKYAKKDKACKQIQFTSRSGTPYCGAGRRF